MAKLSKAQQEVVDILQANTGSWLVKYSYWFKNWYDTVRVGYEPSHLKRDFDGHLVNIRTFRALLEKDVIEVVNHSDSDHNKTFYRLKGGE